jgi:hypothetical protein
VLARFRLVGVPPSVGFAQLTSRVGSLTLSANRSDVKSRSDALGLTQCNSRPYADVEERRSSRADRHARCLGEDGRRLLATATLVELPHLTVRRGRCWLKPSDALSSIAAAFHPTLLPPAQCSPTSVAQQQSRLKANHFGSSRSSHNSMTFMPIDSAGLREMGGTTCAQSPPHRALCGIPESRLQNRCSCCRLRSPDRQLLRGLRPTL